MFGENSSYVTIFLYLNWTEATKIEWKLWKWHRYFETIDSLKHMLLTSQTESKTLLQWIVDQVLIISYSLMRKFKTFISTFNFMGKIYPILVPFSIFPLKCMVKNNFNQRLSRACIVHLVVKKNQLVLCKNYVLQWQSSWNYDQHKKHNVCKGPSND